MNSRNVRFALLALAAFGAFTIARLGYNVYRYDPTADLLRTVQTEALAGASNEVPLNYGPEGYYTRSSSIWLSVPAENFQSAQSGALDAKDQARVLHRKQSRSGGTEYAALQIRISEQKAENMLSSMRAAFDVLRYEENRADKNEQFSTLQARLEALQQTKTRITITPEQFKLSASRELSEEAAQIQSTLQEYQAARLREPEQALTIVFIKDPGLTVAATGSLVLDAIWWSIALFGALAILALFGFLIWKLFQGGRDLLGKAAREGSNV